MLRTNIIKIEKRTRTNRKRHEKTQTALENGKQKYNEEMEWTCLIICYFIGNRFALDSAAWKIVMAEKLPAEQFPLERELRVDGGFLLWWAKFIFSY